MTPPPSPQSGPPGDDRATAILTVLVAYVIAVGVAVAGFLGVARIGGNSALGLVDMARIVGAALPIALVLALPGFVLVRLALWFARRGDGLSFAVAGAINGLATVLVMKGVDLLSGAGESVTPLFAILGPMVLCGVAAGVVCWAVERLLGRLSPGQPW